jgi:hypothetical protein
MINNTALGLVLECMPFVSKIISFNADPATGAMLKALNVLIVLTS